jgi:CHAT domain-containing protein/uncharacterized protein HemY
MIAPFARGQTLKSVTGFNGPGSIEDVNGPRQLKVGEVHARKLLLTQSHPYTLQLSKAQYARLLIKGDGSDLLIVIRLPTGAKLIETCARQFGFTPLSFIAQTSGTYSLSITSGHPRAVQTNYTVSLEAVRKAAHVETQLARAEIAHAAAEFLRISDEAESIVAAIAKYREALAFYVANARVKEQAIALKSIGELYFRTGAYGEAVKHLERAIALRRAIANTEEEAELLNSFGYALLAGGFNDRALVACNEALALFQKLGVQKGVAQALTNVGEVHYGLSNLDKSIECYAKALLFWEKLANDRGRAQTLLDFGISYSLLRDSVKSLEYLDKARELWQEVGDRRGEAFTLTVIGIEYTRTGEWQKAASILDKALALVEVTGDVLGRARILNCLGYLRAEAGKKDQALSLYTEALSLFATMGRQAAVAGTHLNVGRTYVDLGERQKALNHFQAALTLAKTLNDPLRQGYILFDIASTYDINGNQQEALANYSRALNLFRSGGDRMWEARSYNSVASVYARAGEDQKASENLDKALSIVRAINNPRETALTLHSIAVLMRRGGNLTAAKAKIEEALTLSEALRTRVSTQELRTSYFASVHKQFEFYIDLLMTLNKQNPNHGYDRLALAASERARARSFVETLAETHADIRHGVDSVLLDQERSLRKLLSELADRQIRLRSQAQHHHELQTIEKRIEELTTQFEQVEGRIKAASSRYAALTQPAPLTATSLQQLIDPDTVLLEYSLGDEHSFLWAVTHDSVASFEIAGRDAIERAARRMYEAITARNLEVKGENAFQKQLRVRRAESQYEDNSRALSAMLLTQVVELLPGKRLVIVADGLLQYIPFGALPHPLERDSNTATSENSFTPLIARHEIINLPSASVLALQRRDHGNRRSAPLTLAVIADPVFDRADPRAAPLRSSATDRSQRLRPTAVQETTDVLRDVGLTSKNGAIQRLPFSRQEADQILSLVPRGSAIRAVDFAASRATVTTSDLSKYRILHFATHGLLNNEHPELSGILLSMVDEKGKPQNGFLQLHEIYSLTLPADLVVLSACQTALGRDVKGEGLVGLTRGFMSAGATRVVASLWKVDDAATAALMTAFYKEMFTNSKKPGAALREAQRQIASEKRWQSPYYWAGFVMQGEWK